MFLVVTLLGATSAAFHGPTSGRISRYTMNHENNNGEGNIYLYTRIHSAMETVV